MNINEIWLSLDTLKAIRDDLLKFNKEHEYDDIVEIISEIDDILSEE